MSRSDGVVVTGLGTVNAIARDVPAFEAALREGRSGFATIGSCEGGPSDARWVAAPVGELCWRELLDGYEDSLPDATARARRILRNSPGSLRLSVVAAFEAMQQAGLASAGLDRERIGVVVAGSNLHQALVWEQARALTEDSRSMNPRYGLNFLDSSQVGALGEIFRLHGMGYSLGGASASGNLAIFQAWHWLRSGLLDACLVVGAAMDLSPLELEALALIGALGGEGFLDRPEQACRPFDREHGGFIWGQGSGALVLERRDTAAGHGAAILGEILGAAVAMDGNHLPDSNLEGELRAMRGALAAAGLGPEALDYVNAHGTSTPLGDRTECAALKSLLGERAGEVWVNSTKSLIGHCLSAAGVIEAIACLLQLNHGFLHPNLNLQKPIDPDLRFVGASPVSQSCSIALTNGFGFGGFNGSIVLGRGEI